MIFKPFFATAMLTCALASTTLLTACSPSGAAPAASAAAASNVTVAHPESAEVQDSMDYTGRIEPAHSVEVRSRVSGYLAAIKFHDGQQVRAGDALFVIDQRPMAATRDRAQANLAQSTARKKLAGAQFERLTRLQATGASSTEELDRARGELEGAQAAVLLGLAELRSAELELSFTTVRAPIAGRVSDRRVDVGSYLAGGAAQGGVLTTIVAQSPVRAMVDVSETDYQRLRTLKKFPEQVQVSLDGVSGSQSAKIDFVDNEISPRSGTVRLRASMANADQAVAPGNFARVRIPVGAPQTRLLVPDAAIQSDQTQKLVWLVDAKGVVAPQRVELGGLVGSKHVVLSGLQAQDQVIVAGAQRVRPGDHVQIAMPAAAK